MEKTGIYIIKNEINGKIYVGSSINIERRYKLHKTLLNKNKHHSSKLQRAYNKYGKDKFFYEIIQYCNKEVLIKNEQYWINHFDSFNNGYNSLPNANSRTGYIATENEKKKNSEAKKGNKNPMFGKKHSKESLDKISEASKNRIRKPFSEESKKKMSETHKRLGTKPPLRIKNKND